MKGLEGKENRMTRVSIIGATGSLGRVVTNLLLDETDVELKLFARSAASLPDSDRVEKIGASVSDRQALEEAIQGADVVFASLSGNLPSMVSDIIAAMGVVGVQRIIWISSYGIYGELPGQNGQVAGILQPYRQAADILEASDLDYTILRPVWFDDSKLRSYHLIPKGEIVDSNHISRLAIADFVKELVLNPNKYIKANLAIVRD